MQVRRSHVTRNHTRVTRHAGEALPCAELDLDVGAFGRVCCAMLDIPVQQSLKESLHALFTLCATAAPSLCGSPLPLIV